MLFRSGKTIPSHLESVTPQACEKNRLFSFFYDLNPGLGRPACFFFYVLNPDLGRPAGLIFLLRSQSGFWPAVGFPLSSQSGLGPDWTFPYREIQRKIRRRRKCLEIWAFPYREIQRKIRRRREICEIRSIPYREIQREF